MNAVSLRAFARHTGINFGRLLTYARDGRLIGARYNWTTRQWWVHAPAKLALSDGLRHKPQPSTFVRLDSAPASPSTPPVKPYA